jgi:hypothetical protein
MVSRLTAALILIAVGAGCATTTYRSTWRAPDVERVDYSGKKVAAVFVSDVESTRRAAEDTLARELTARGSVGVASYPLLSGKDLADDAGARKKLVEAGCAGAVVMRVVGEEQRIRSTSGTYPGAYTFSMHSGGAYGVGVQSGYLTTDTIVSVETLVYSLDPDKLVWTGTSETFEPAEIEEFVVELATAAAEEMKKEGLIR